MFTPGENVVMAKVRKIKSGMKTIMVYSYVGGRFGIRKNPIKNVDS